MELKDVVLSTLAEMEDNLSVKDDLNKSIGEKSYTKDVVETPMEYEISKKETEEIDDAGENSVLDDEMNFLTSIRERLLVLFEGFQAPNNTQIEAKVDMTLNFLEYTLATIDSRIDKIKKR